MKQDSFEIDIVRALHFHLHVNFGYPSCNNMKWSELCRDKRPASSIESRLTACHWFRYVTKCDLLCFFKKKSKNVLTCSFNHICTFSRMTLAVVILCLLVSAVAAQQCSNSDAYEHGPSIPMCRPAHRRLYSDLFLCSKARCVPDWVCTCPSLYVPEIPVQLQHAHGTCMKLRWNFKVKTANLTEVFCLLQKFWRFLQTVSMVLGQQQRNQRLTPLSWLESSWGLIRSWDATVGCHSKSATNFFSRGWVSSLYACFARLCFCDPPAPKSNSIVFPLSDTCNGFTRHHNHLVFAPVIKLYTLTMLYVLVFETINVMFSFFKHKTFQISSWGD